MATKGGPHAFSRPFKARVRTLRADEGGNRQTSREHQRKIRGHRLEPDSLSIPVPAISPVVEPLRYERRGSSNPPERRHESDRERVCRVEGRSERGPNSERDGRSLARAG